MRRLKHIHQNKGFPEELCVKQLYVSSSFLYKIATGIILLLFSLTAFVQTKEIVVLEKGTSTPVPFANIHIRSLNSDTDLKCINNKNGILKTSFRDSVIIHIEALGYSQYTDTIIPAEKTILYLNPSVYDLDKVIVTGQFRPQPMKESVYNIEIIDKNRIDRIGANNLGQVLNNNVEFQFLTEGVLGNFIRMNGLTGEHIKILIDDIPVTGRQTSIIDLNQLSMYNVKRIEIINGPSSVIYGSNALAGVINIITDDHMNKKYTLNSNMYFENIGIYNFDVVFSVRQINHVFSLNAGRNFHSGYKENDNERFHLWKPKLQYMTGIGYSYRKKNIIINYRSDYIHEELRDLDSLSLEPIDEYHFTKRWNNRFDISNSARKKIFFKSQLGYSYYSKSKLTYVNDRINQTRFISPVTGLNDTTVFHLLFTRGFHSNKLSCKYEYQLGYDVNYETADGKKIGGIRTLGDLAFFLNFIYKPFENTSIQPGIRYNMNTKYNSTMIYALNMKWSNDNLSIRGSYGKGFRNPSLKELHYEFTDQIHEIYGNKNLEAEAADHISIATQLQLQMNKSVFTLNSEFFYNVLNKKIELVYDIEDRVYGTYFNIPVSDFKTTGAEFKLSYRYDPAFSISGGMNLVGRSSLQNLSDYLYTTDFSFSADYTNYKNNFQISILYKYIDDFIEYHYRGSLDEISEARMDNFHNLDIAFIKNFWKNKIIITTGVKNIFNNILINSMGNISFHGSSNGNTVIGWGRTWFVKAGVRISK